MSTIGRANVDLSTNEGVSFMHLARRAWCRTYQTVFRITLPILPYTEPRILEHAEDVPAVLQKRSIQKVLIVTDPGIARLGLTASLERALTAQGIGVTVYAETRMNPRSQTWRKRRPCIERAPARLLSALAVARPWTAPRAWAHALRSKQAHQQDARPAADSSSPAASHRRSHHGRHGKRSHARGGNYR